MLLLLIFLILGLVSAAIASSKGRSVVGWFFIGGLFGLLPIIILLVLPNLKDEKSYRDHSDRENRRLREQLYQERVKNESFRQHATDRIDSHDQHLGLDTRQTRIGIPIQDTGYLLEEDDGWNEPETDTLLPAVDQPVQRENASAKREWHYVAEGETVGPISQSHLLSMLRSGELDGSTLLWTERLNDWKEAKQISGLRRFINP